jgi:hypothetical protein
MALNSNAKQPLRMLDGQKDSAVQSATPKNIINTGEET